MSTSLVQQRLQLELQYQARIEQIEKGNLHDIDAVFTQAQSIFSQHWILYHLYTLLSECFRERSQFTEAAHYQHARIRYHEDVLPWSTYTLAWAYEELGDITS